MPDYIKSGCELLCLSVIDVDEIIFLRFLRSLCSEYHLLTYVFLLRKMFGVRHVRNLLEWFGIALQAFLDLAICNQYY